MSTRATAIRAKENLAEEIRAPSLGLNIRPMTNSEATYAGGSTTRSSTHPRTLVGVAGATLRAEPNGASAALALGTYTAAQLQAAGIAPRTISSLLVPAGSQVIGYSADNFTGTAWTFTADNADLRGRFKAADGRCV